MIDYDFYVNTYWGTAIPEAAFSAAAARAEQALTGICRRYQLRRENAVSKKMALCAMAELIYSHQKRQGGVSAASVGGVSVRYEDSGSLERQLLQRARIYLDFYRGGSLCSAP